MRGTYTFQYHGILKNFDFDKINRDTFPKLIASNIFDVNELSTFYKSKDDYFGIELDDTNWEINNFYLFNNKEYHLREIVLDDMFDYCEFKCESQDELQYKILEIDLNINIQSSDYSKIKFLKNEIFIMNQNMIDPQYYLLYSKKRETNGYSRWFEFFRSEQIDNEDYTFIFKYLKGDRDFVPTFIKQIWQDYFIVKHLTDYCKNKIQIIESNSGINEVDVLIENTTLKLKNVYNVENKELIKEYSNDIGKDIFKEDYYSLFEYIVQEYGDKKNKAFFSYLYHYFNDNKYLLKNAKSSTKYNDFLVNNSFINSFSKVIQRVYNEVGDEDKRMVEIFNNYRDNFIQKKMKEN